VLARARWRYDRSTRVLRVDARVGAGGSMRVVGCAALAPRPPAFTG
jgi:hypothetical protein